MIPGGDHSSRTLLLRRVSSWSEVATAANTEVDDNASLPSSVAHDDSSLPSRPLLPNLEYEEEYSSGDEGGNSTSSRDPWRQWRRRINWKLWVVFVLMVLSGVGNVLLAKLSSYRLYNYPTFLNMYSNVIYIFMSFSYIVPVGRFGWFHRSIPRAHWTSLPKRPFAIMGCLDAVSATVQVLANVYLPGTLLVLIPQAAIPLSMLGSRLVLRERYSFQQYLGASVVLVGILVVLLPVFTHMREADHYCRAIDEVNDCTLCQVETTESGCLSHIKTTDNYDPLIPLPRLMLLRQNHSNHGHNSTDDNSDGLFCAWISRDEAIKDEDFLVWIWSIFMLLSLIPMVMSTIYKQVALQVQLDPILVNGWVSLFQFVFGMVLVVPAGMVSSPRVHPLELGSNWKNGLQCLFTQTNSVEAGCHPDDCFHVALWVHLGLISATVYALSMMFVLKYGSCDLMYLGLTLVVPLAHLSFSLHSTADVGAYDICGLLVSVAGLAMYRFGYKSLLSWDTVANEGGRHHQETPREGNDGSYQPLTLEVGNENDNGDDRVVDAAGEHNMNATNNAKEGGFLEFLREPFLLVGDI